MRKGRKSPRGWILTPTGREWGGPGRSLSSRTSMLWPQAAAPLDQASAPSRAVAPPAPSAGATAHSPATSRLLPLPVSPVRCPAGPSLPTTTFGWKVTRKAWVSFRRLLGPGSWGNQLAFLLSTTLSPSSALTEPGQAERRPGVLFQTQRHWQGSPWNPCPGGKALRAGLFLPLSEPKA